MIDKKTRWLLSVFSFLILLPDGLSALAFTEPMAYEASRHMATENAMGLAAPEDKISLIFRNSDEAIVQQVQSLVPVSLHMVDSAIAVLSKGWAGMTPTERHVFRRFYDPADTGDIDEAFVKTVLNNYEQIQEEYSDTFVIEFETNSEMCRNMRLFYTDLIKVHACPYLNAEENVNRGAREFVHELAHKALLVVDRPYYTPNSTRYAALKPRGHWSAQVPFIGRIFREIAHRDTLYHPDAYSHFALEAYEGLDALDVEDLDHTKTITVNVEVEIVAEAGSADWKFTN